MFKRILVPLDGSLRAERALPLAARLARASQGMLILLRVVSAVAEENPATPSQSLVMRTLAQTQMQEADRYLTALASSQTLADISLTVAALPGHVVSTIETAIQIYQADLLILCAQRDSSKQSESIGGLAGRLTEHLTAPLLLIPEHGPVPFSSRVRQEHPLIVHVAFDRFPSARALVQAASSLLVALDDRGQGHLHFVPTCASALWQREAPLLHVHEGHPPFSLAALETAQARAGGVLLQERESGAQKPIQAEDADVFVLEMPAEAAVRRGMAWASKDDIPLFFVPSREAKYP